MRSRPSVLSAAVEGAVDEAVAARLVEHLGGSLGTVYGKHGKAKLRKSISGFNQAASHGRWFVLVDLNGDERCAPVMRRQWLPLSAPFMCFRVAVREVESWLLADRERLARFLGVNRSLIPPYPESLSDPKATLVKAAANSRSRAMREDMAPRQGSGRPVGPAYSSRLIDFVRNLETGWRPEVAAMRADSLARCMDRLSRLIQS